MNKYSEGLSCDHFYVQSTCNLFVKKLHLGILHDLQRGCSVISM